MIMSKRKIIIITLAVMVIGLTVFIFSNSLTVGKESAQQSGKIVNLVKELLNSVNIHPDDHNLSFFIRKGAHFSEYFALGLFTAMLFKSLLTKEKFVFLSPIYCYIIALCDEFICQRITEGRGPQLTDTLIDLSGALLATLLVFVVLYFKSKKDKNYEK